MHECTIIVVLAPTAHRGKLHANVHETASIVVLARYCTRRSVFCARSSRTRAAQIVLGIYRALLPHATDSEASLIQGAERT